MVLKPFPFPLDIGIDVCKIPRIARLISDPEVCNRWAQRVFTRLEWPQLCRLVEKVQPTTVTHVQKENPYRKTLPEARVTHTRECARIDKSIWMLPEIPPERFQWVNGKIVYTRQSPVGVLVRYLAGRWAAKEAVIKAHTRRRLYMRDISIISPRSNPGIFPDDAADTQKPTALIDPVATTISMDERVAEIRGLRGFGPQSTGLLRGPLSIYPDVSVYPNSKDVNVSDDGSSQYLERRAKVEESQRQIAQVSISHDGDTAVAVCLASNELEPEPEQKSIIDDGRHDPIHEPQWGDEGWFSEDDYNDIIAKHEE